MGSSAAEQLTPAQEAQYGAMTLREIRRMDLLLEDPLLDSWLQTLGYRLVSGGERTTQDFTFFILRERQVNAFATLGGVVGVNSGLILTAEREDEVAGVLAHEISHVTQKHVLRAVERASKDQIPILLGMLAAVVAAQQSDSSSSGDATQAVLAGGLGLMQQRQIDYTRSNESEADRIGIQRLAAAGYDPSAMASFFMQMARLERNNTGGRSAPEYLRTHPVTTTRVSEARQRAERLAEDTDCVTTWSPDSQGHGGTLRGQCRPRHTAAAGRIDNPLLPRSLAAVSPAAAGEVGARFAWAKERMRVLTASSPNAAEAEYRQMGDTARLDPPQRYGLALAYMRMGRADDALTILGPLAAAEPDDLWITLAQAEAEHAAGHVGTSRQRFEQLLRRFPNNRAVALAYARVLGEIGTREAGDRAQALLRPMLKGGTDDPELQVRFARAAELAGDTNRAAEAHAEAAFLNGRAEDALNQLQALKNDVELDYYQRARIDARIAAMTPIVLEMRRQGLRPEDQGRSVAGG
nr:M48 family metalloprotease [Coralloluteibacterium stylophorae]